MSFSVAVAQGVYISGNETRMYSTVMHIVSNDNSGSIKPIPDLILADKDRGTSLIAIISGPGLALTSDVTL